MATEAPARESVIAFRVTNAESREIDKAAVTAKMDRPEYLRMRVLGNAAGAAPAEKSRKRTVSVEKSPRLKAILELLVGAGEDGITSAEIARRMGGLAIATSISEIRRSGYAISCAFEGLSPQGSRVYKYVLK